MPITFRSSRRPSDAPIPPAIEGEILVTDESGGSLGITLDDPGESITVTDESGGSLGITL